MNTGMLSKAEVLFRRQLDRGSFPGGQLVVRIRGEELLNVSLGIACGFRNHEGERVLVTDTTPFQVMSASKPRYRRGTLAYHPYEFGWILGEVVRRVAGQPLDRFLTDVLPESLRLLCLRRENDDKTVIARTYWLGPKRLRLGGQDVAGAFEERNNARRTLTSLVPGSSMTTTASTLAQFYEMLLAGGTIADGTRLVGSGTLEHYLTPNVSGFDRTLRSYVVLGRGFQLGWLGPHPYGWWDSRLGVGHGGGFCVMVFGDRRTDAAIAMVTNGNRGLWDVFRRFTPLSSAIKKAIAFSSTSGKNTTPWD
jgi:CubicO group peptidase (beta-lactamase class C family)